MPRPPKGPPSRREPLRAVPILARLAPKKRPCADCRFVFADRNPYETLCKLCRQNPNSPRARSARERELLFWMLFAVLFVPAAMLLDAATGLWEWNWALRTGAVAGMGRRGRGLTSLVVLLPALVPTALLAGAAAWGLQWAWFRLTRK